jgi:arabinogalactan endo-1,4-beta-galactosidase
MRGRCFHLLCFAVLVGCAASEAPSGGSGAVSGGSGGATQTGSGGGTGSGGATGTGGVIGTGGGVGTGGAAGTGGAIGTGGVIGTGGGVGTDGAAGTGGAIGTGGGGGGAAPGTDGSTGLGGSTPLTSSYFIGTDISRVQTDPAGTLYTDNDGTRKDMLVLLKGHGFNYIRVRTFVDPRAADGNDKTNGFYDVAHTITFGKRIKDAGMGFLLDFHYSDNWADPGKQCVPVAWQSATTIAALATLVHDYTKDAITRLVAGGARPDMVAIGNEITPGMLIHLCNSGGQPLAGTAGYNPINGALYLYSSTDVGAPPAGGPAPGGWTNLGMLLKAGVAGVKEVDPNIRIMLHIDRAQDLASSRLYITNAMAQAVPFDVFAESAYSLAQAPSSAWGPTFTQLATMFPSLQFVAAEYGPDERLLNDILFGLPNQQGIGTFYWEATHSGADNAGHLLFSNRVAQPDLLLYDAMKTAYAGRL